MTWAAVAVLAIGNVAFGATWTNTTGGRTPATALDWNDSANWGGETPPSVAGDVADFSNLTDDTYIRIPSAITIAEVKNTGSGRPILIGDAGITLLRSKGTDDSCALAKVAFYADLSFNHTGSSYLDVNGVEFCGDLQVAPYLRNKDGSFSFRADRYAKDSNPVRVNSFDLRGWGRCVLGNANAMFVAPRGSDAVKGLWTRTKDSPYLTFAGDTSHALAAGTLVMGEGFVEGTSLKRIFPDGTIELSTAADSSGTGELEFAAFAPRMTIQADTFAYYGAYPQLNFAKWRKEDVFRFEANTLSPTYNIYIGQSLPEGTIPATLVLHDAQAPSSSYDFQVDQAHFEFAPRITMTDAPGIHGKLAFRGAASQLRVTVTNNISAVLGGFKTHSGTFVKDGVGTLTFGVAPAKTATGSIVAVEGVLALSAEVPEETSYVKTLAISNGAVVRLPEGGFTCDVLTFEPGAVVEGPGYLVLADTTAAEGLAFTKGARAVTPDQVALKAGDYGYDIVAVPSELPSVPAAWFDASRLDSMTTVTNDDGTIRVSQWNDVRGAAHRFCVANGLMPKLVTNALGRAQHIYIQKGTHSSADTSQCYALFFDRELPRIKHVFRVINCREGGGQFLAKNESGYKYQRARTGDFKVKLFQEEYGTVPDYPFYVNGVRSNWRDGFAYPGGNMSTAEADLVPLLAELHFGELSATIDNFGWQRYVDRDGQERTYESIYYTNTLTQAEVEQVRAYLMKKWLNSEVAHERLPGGTAALGDVVAGDATVYARPGGAVVVQNVSGAGELVTAGGGEVCVDDLADATRDVHVKAGTLKVRSYAPDSVPGDPYFHGDADDTDSFTLNDKSQITAWADTRGGDNTVATWNKNKPLLRVDASLAGHKAIDFGTMQQSGYHLDYRCMLLPEFDGVHTVFSVLNTANGGGPLLGADGDRANLGYVRNGRLWGIARLRNGASDPIIHTGYWYAQLEPAATSENKFSLGLNRAGATRTRLNGADVNGTGTGYTGGWDMVSVATHDPLIVNSIGSEIISSYWWGGGLQLGEHILYAENLSDETVKRVEAYLSKKWFGRETPGYRPATMGAVTVDAGATLALVGEAPLTVKSLAGAGTVSGRVEMSGAGDLTIAINDDGTVGATQASGGLTLPATGVIRVTGLVRNLAKGETLAIANVTGDVAGWTVTLVDDPEKAEFLSVFVRDGKLYLNRTAPGLMLLVK